MAALIFNIAKGKIAANALLPATNDALIILLCASTGLVSDAILRDLDDVSTIMAGATNEATFTGYARVTATSVTVTIDDTNDWVDIDCADPSWSPTTAEALGKLIIAYDPDTTAGTDTTLVPQMADDYVMTTPTTGTIGYTVAPLGFARAS